MESDRRTELHDDIGIVERLRLYMLVIESANIVETAVEGITLDLEFVSNCAGGRIRCTTRSVEISGDCLNNWKGCSTDIGCDVICIQSIPQYIFQSQRIVQIISRDVCN